MTDDPFVTHRSLLFTVAYEMLGSAADAEDVVQETWLRWADVRTADGTYPFGDSNSAISSSLCQRLTAARKIQVPNVRGGNICD